MKKVLVRIFSALLVAACLLGIVFGAMNISSILDTKSYWEDVKAFALENFDKADAGIGALKENCQGYMDGTDKLVSAEEALAAADVQLGIVPGKLQDGKEMLDENLQAYEEGKAMLAQIEPIYNAAMGHYNAWQAKQAEYDAAVAAGDKLKAAMLWPQVEAMRITYEGALGGYGLDYIVSQYNEGMAKIQQYEQGMHDYADGSYKYQEGVKAYEEGKEGVAEAKEKLGVYEDGQAALAEGLDTILAEETFYNEDGSPIVTKISERFPAGWTYYAQDEAGNIILRNGCRFVDLDKAAELVLAGRAFVDDTEVAVTHECMGQVYSTLALLIACVVGLIAGIFGLCAKGLTAGIMAVIAAAGAAAGLIVDAAMNGFKYPLTDISIAQAEAHAAAAPVLLGLGLLLAAAVLAAVFGFICGNAGKAPKAAEAAPAEEKKADAAGSESETLLIARADAEKARAEAEKAKAEAEKAKADAERVKAELELARLKAGSKEEALV